MLLFAGTTEGRIFYETLNKAGIHVDVCVATEYGKEIIDKDSGHIFAGRLDKEQMKSLILQNKYSLVVDATHPYAVEVTKNIKAVCAELSVEYIRLLREEGDCKNVIACGSVEEAVEYLRHKDGNILSTIGSKELRHFTSLHQFEKRVFARILPLPDAVASCMEMGFTGSRLICMQGPFSAELNCAMLKQYNCSFLVSKNSGDAGGLPEKLAAAEQASAKVVLIGRPSAEQGLSVEEALALAIRKSAVKTEALIPKKRYFPLFIDISDKLVLVAGAGKIAERRIRALLKFGCRIKVVAPERTAGISAMSLRGQIDMIAREFLEEDLTAAFLVVAATNDREVNRSIGCLSRGRNIPVSVADCKEECSFFFPAVIEDGDAVIGITGEGKNHHAVKELADRIRDIL